MSWFNQLMKETNTNPFPFINKPPKPPEGKVVTGYRPQLQIVRGGPNVGRYEKQISVPIYGDAPKKKEEAPVAQPAPAPRSAPAPDPTPAPDPDNGQDDITAIVSDPEPDIKKTQPFQVKQEPVTISNPAKRKVRGGINQFSSSGNSKALPSIKSKLLNV